jgi:magnesium transporter
MVKSLRYHRNLFKEKIGKPPGTLVYTGAQDTGKATFTLTQYSPDDYQIKEVSSASKAIDSFEKEKVNWLNVKGLSDIESIKEIGQKLGLHSLVLEDILHVNQPPKIEIFDNYLFVTLKYLYIKETKDIGVEHFSMVMGKNYIVSFQETGLNYLEPIFDRIKSSTTKVKQRKADYLLYYLIDLMADYYYLIEDKIEEEVDGVEIALYEGFEEDIINRILSLKKKLTEIKRSLHPLLDELISLKRHETDFFEAYVVHYLNDVLDHLKQLEASIISKQEVLSGLTDLYMSIQSNKMNKVMYVLTLIAAIFIPLTFLAGIYGMNFDHMPELHYKNAYFILLGVMLVIGIFILLIMRRKKWL